MGASPRTIAALGHTWGICPGYHHNLWLWSAADLTPSPSHLDKVPLMLSSSPLANPTFSGVHALELLHTSHPVHRTFAISLMLSSRPTTILSTPRPAANWGSKEGAHTHTHTHSEHTYGVADWLGWKEGRGGIACARNDGEGGKRGTCGAPICCSNA